MKRSVSWKLLVLVLQVAVVPGTAIAQNSPGPCTVTDLMPRFWSFWQQARNSPPQRQVALFHQLVERPDSAVYRAIFADAPIPIDTLIAGAMKEVRAREDTMRILSSVLAHDLPTRIDHFRKTFPAFQCSAPVYFLVSAGAFDGATRTVNGQEALMFGLDVVARTQGTALGPLAMHELFHVYHGQVIRDEPQAFYWNLWEEGLATWVSRVLNPDQPESRACCLPPALDSLEAARPRLVRETLGLLDSHDQDQYARFFYGGRKLDIPSRSGYYVGYLVARELGRTRTPAQLAALTPSQVKPLIQEALRLPTLAGHISRK